MSGQSISEFAMLLAIIGMAFAGTQIYLQRGFSARYKGGVDYMFSRIEEDAQAQGLTNANLTDISSRMQYAPTYQTSNISVYSESDNSVGFPRATINETVSRSGLQSLRSAHEGS